MLPEIEASVSRAHEIIRALRTLFKQAPKVLRPADLDDVIHEVVRIARSEIERHGTGVCLDLAASSASMLGDATQLKQVVLNLLQNGMEAMDGLPPERRRVEVTSRVTATEVTVLIRDFGSGLAPDARRGYEPTFTTKASGMGMGLAICKSIIDAHDGVLTALSEDVGTSF